MGCHATNTLDTGLTLRCVSQAFHESQHEWETPTQAVSRIVSDELNVARTRIGVIWFERRVARLLVDGNNLTATELSRVAPLLPFARPRRLVLLDRVSRIDVDKMPDIERVLDEIETTDATDVTHAATLLAAIGHDWDIVPVSQRSIWVQRARRLRKRWGCDETQSLRDEISRLSKALHEADEAGGSVVASAEIAVAAAKHRVEVVEAEAAKLRQDVTAALRTIEASVDDTVNRSEWWDRYWRSLHRAAADVVETWGVRDSIKVLGDRIQDLKKALE